MGIQGLLPLLKSIEKPIHLKDYAGQTLAVDGYVWLHKGAFACAQDLCLGQPTQKYVSYFMRKIEMFKFFGVKPFVVFDGGYLPSKAATEDDRQSRRDESKKQAMDLLRAGKSKMALEQFRKCVDVTPEMAYAVIQALKAAHVQYIVAPYEADAQLAYLEKTGVVDGIVTEDSDLLVFGCRRVIFKLDQYGAGVEILHDNFSRVSEVSFHEWTMTEIRHMCILSGCDYLPSIPGMGLKTAQRLLRRFKTFERVIKYIRMESTSMKVPSDYEASFLKADLTFLYARVFDPVTKGLVHLNPVPEDLRELVMTEEYDFLGPALEAAIAQEVAAGSLNPITKKALHCPVSSGTALKAVSEFGGKENRPATLPYVAVKSAMPSTKSIHSYFVKTTTTATPTTISAPLATIRKREPLQETGLAALKRRVLNRPDASDLSTNIAPPILDSGAKVNQATLKSEVIVEAKSRFFGFGEPTEPIVVPATSIKAKAVREDSGIGLDEAGLLGTEQFAPLGQVTETRLSQESTPDRLVSKEAKEKVIQGWREKFSSTASNGSVRTPGLTRAFQARGATSSLKAPLMKSAKSTHTDAVKLSSTAAVAGRLGTSGSNPPSHKESPAGRGVVLTAPGLPQYHLGRVIAPNKARLGTSGPKKSSARSVVAEDVVAPTLGLDRFKYTQPSVVKAPVL